MSDRSLDVYLNDHMAGARFGSDLARRVAERMGKATMHAVAAEIEEDRQTLARVLDRLGTSRNAIAAARRAFTRAGAG
jgi:hypothetical protein